MPPMKIVKWIALGLLIVFVVWYFWPPTTTQNTTLELESNGGFAYLQPSSNLVEIAYLPKIDNMTTGCHVPESRVRLWVVRGKVVAPSGTPEKREFDLRHTVVRFADLETSSASLVVNRTNPPASPPFGPVPASDPTLWKDLKWLPRVYDRYPGSSLNPTVPVDGKVVLTRGNLSGLHPSDVVVQDALFDFKKTPTGPVEFTQALTDRTLFTVSIPKAQIVINLTGSTEGVSQIIVAPEAPGKAVKLKMIGLHDEMTPPSIPLGAPVTHFCGFYELLQPVPTAQILPYFAGNPAVTAANRPGQPSPGALCPSDFN
jgi:hypothetical protein